MEINKFIKHRRLELGKTLEEVGKEVGVSKATVQRWESGLIKNMRRDKLMLLSKALKTTPGYLMGWATIEDNKKELSPIKREFIEKVQHMNDEEIEKLNSLLDLFLAQKTQ